MRPALALILAALPFSAQAGIGPPTPVQCDEELADCKETCTMSHGTSRKPATKAKFKKCMSRCSFREKDCREAVMESGRGGSNSEVAEKEKKGSSASQESGPYRASSKEDRDAASKKLDDERKAEDARRAEEAKRRTESQRAADERRTGKSKPAEAEKQPEKQPAKTTEPAAAPKEEPKKKEKEKQANPDEASSSEKKPPKKEQRALDEWDPDAL